MTKNFYKLLTGVAICAASTVAFANGDNYHSTGKSYAKPGFSVGIDGGYGYMSSPEETYPNNYTVDEEYKYTSDADVGDYTWGVHVAYDFKVRPNTLLGFELGYKDLGSNHHQYAYEDLSSAEDQYYFQGSRDYQQNAVDLLLTAHCYLYQGFNVFGKVGAAYVRSDVTQTATSDTDSEFFNIPLSALEGETDIWRLEPEVSLGVGYTFSNHVDVHAAYTYIGGANDQPIVETGITDNNSMYQSEAKVYSTNMLMLGISYIF